MYKQELPVKCDLTECSLEDAFFLLPANKVLSLWVHESQLGYTRSLLLKLQCLTRKNPFAPYINICLSPLYQKYEWSLHSGEESVGSPGA